MDSKDNHVISLLLELFYFLLFFGISQKNKFMVFAIIFGLLAIVPLTSRFFID